MKEGGCRRYDCEDTAPQLIWLVPASLHKPCGFTLPIYYLNYLIQCIANGRSLFRTPAVPGNLHGNGFPIHAEPTNNIKPPACGQVYWVNFRRTARFTVGCPMFDARFIASTMGLLLSPDPLL